MLLLVQLGLGKGNKKKKIYKMDTNPQKTLPPNSQNSLGGRVKVIYPHMAPEVDNWKTGCALGTIPFDWSFLLLSPRVVNLAFFDLLVLTFVFMTGGVEIVGSSKAV